MKTTDLFTSNRNSKRLNESFEKVFGKRIELENFDLHQLQDARNKLRTQISQVRSQSGFNETIESEALTKAQWMLDAINSEISHREEYIIDSVQEGFDPESWEGETAVSWIGDDGEEVDGVVYYTAKADPESGRVSVELTGGDVTGNNYNAKVDDAMIADLIKDPDYNRDYIEAAQEAAQDEYDSRDKNDSDYDDSMDGDHDSAMASAGFGSDEDYGYYGDDQEESLETEAGFGRRDRSADWDEGNTEPPNNFAIYINGKKWKVFAGRGTYADDHREMAQLRQLQDWCRKKSESTGKKWEVSRTGEKATESVGESAPPGGKYERMVKHIKKGYAKDGKLSDKERSIAYATAWKAKNKASESVQGEDMKKLTEGEIQQAQSIVTAKTMVDRVGRWIEELSGMENETLLQLGDQIRDEMGSEQAKNFISGVAPAIQQALENLKTTRETLATGVRTLTGEEQAAGMLGGEEGGDEFGGASEPDMMNPPEEAPIGGEDEFAAAEPAAGGLEDTGREQRESINYQSRLLKVLAG